MEIIKIMLAFMVLINPSAALMLFVNYTHGYSDAQKKKMAFIACSTVFITIAFFAIFGELLLKGLGISLGSFRVAGGILLFLIALSMMNEGSNPAKSSHDDAGEQAGSLTGNAVVPLAIPMMIGPGGISTVIIYSSHVHSWGQIGLIVLAGFLISVFCYVSLMAAGRISQFLGDTGISVINRIMGIILAALAIEIVVNGLRAIFPQLGV